MFSTTRRWPSVPPARNFPRPAVATAWSSQWHRIPSIGCEPCSPPPAAGAPAIAAQETGDHEQALHLADAALAETPRLPFWWAVRGDALSALGRLDEAAGAFESACGNAPSKDDGLFLAVALYSGQPEVAAYAAEAGLPWAAAAAGALAPPGPPGGVRTTFSPTRKAPAPAAAAPVETPASPPSRTLPLAAVLLAGLAVLIVAIWLLAAR